MANLKLTHANVTWLTSRQGPQVVVYLHGLEHHTFSSDLRHMERHTFPVEPTCVSGKKGYKECVQRAIGLSVRSWTGKTW